MDDALAGAARDPALTETVLFLACLPGAARQSNFVNALRAIGITTKTDPSLIDTLAGLERAIDRESRMRGGRTDFGEIAQLAAATSITSLVSPDLPTMFGTTPADVKTALAKLDTPDRFAKLSRKFFANLMQRGLEYQLSRTYARSVGRQETFSSISKQEEFRSALATHCYEAALIVEQYSADWFSKSKHDGGMTRQRAKVLARTALQKLRRELSNRNRPDV